MTDFRAVEGVIDEATKVAGLSTYALNRTMSAARAWLSRQRGKPGEPSREALMEFFLAYRRRARFLHDGGTAALDEQEKSGNVLIAAFSRCNAEAERKDREDG